MKFKVTVLWVLFAAWQHLLNALGLGDRAINIDLIFGNDTGV